MSEQSIVSPNSFYSNIQQFCAPITSNTTISTGLYGYTIPVDLSGADDVTLTLAAVPTIGASLKIVVVAAGHDLRLTSSGSIYASIGDGKKHSMGTSELFLASPGVGDSVIVDSDGSSWFAHAHNGTSTKTISLGDASAPLSLGNASLLHVITLTSGTPTYTLPSAEAGARFDLVANSSGTIYFATPANTSLRLTLVSVSGGGNPVCTTSTSSATAVKIAGGQILHAICSSSCWFIYGFVKA